MSTLAKIFVVINLFLAVAFFGSSATLFLNRSNWREAYLKLNKTSRERIAEVEKSFEGPKAKMEAVIKDNQRLKTENGTFSTENVALKKDIETLKVELNKKTDDYNKIVTSNETKDKTIQELTQKIDSKDGTINELRAGFQTAQEESQKAIEDVTRLKLDYDTLNEQHVSALEQMEEVRGQVESYEILVKNAEANGINIRDLNIPPINGLVDAVSSADQLVVLSVGEDQKVKEGYQSYVSRGGEYIGKVRVIQVYKDIAGARITFTRDGESIEVGDRVRTVSFTN